MMIRRSHSAVTGLVAAFLFFFAAAAATAQVPWGGCPNTIIQNLTNCPVRLALQTPVILPAYNVPANQAIVVPTPGVASINGVISAAAIIYPVLPPTGTPCNCPLGAWSVCCVTLPSPAICCFDICFDPLTCTITLAPASCPPGTCRP